MTDKCETCRWWDDKRDGAPTAKCFVFPQRIETNAQYFCGQWKESDRPPPGYFLAPEEGVFMDGDMIGPLDPPRKRFVTVQAFCGTRQSVGDKYNCAGLVVKVWRKK